MSSRFLLSAAVFASLLAPPAFSADHLDSPIVQNDPAADINDYFAFVNPNDPDNLVLAATIMPLANADSRFSSAVEYQFHVASAGAADKGMTISCTFPGAGTIRCGDGADLSIQGSVGQVIESDGVQLYAGLRDDPFFFDLVAFNETVATLSPQFTDPGENFFAGLNTLAIVMSLPSSLVTNAGSDPVIATYASTERVADIGVTGLVSGSFWDPDQSGQGFTIDVVTSNDERTMLLYWMTYDNEGNQQWFLGQGSVEGNATTLELQRTSGAAFPPAFNPDDVEREVIGTADVSFSGCNEATVDFSAADTAMGVNDTVFELERFLRNSDETCTFFSGGQVDRMGRPAVNTALIDLLEDTGKKDSYNQASAVSDWAQFTAEIEATLTALDGLDGETGNTLLPPATLAPVLADDRLLVDTRIASCDAYLAVEVGATDFCGGRTLNRDVIDDTLGAVVGPGVSDFVASDNATLVDFPFLGEPN